MGRSDPVNRASQREVRVRASSSWWFAALCTLAVLLVGEPARGQPMDEEGLGESRARGAPAPTSRAWCARAGQSPGMAEIPADWKGAVRLLRVPGPSATSAESRAAAEISRMRARCGCTCTGPIHGRSRERGAARASGSAPRAARCRCRRAAAAGLARAMPGQRTTSATRCCARSRRRPRCSRCR